MSLRLGGGKQSGVFKLCDHGIPEGNVGLDKVCCAVSSELAVLGALIGVVGSLSSRSSYNLLTLPSSIL